MNSLFREILHRRKSVVLPPPPHVHYYDSDVHWSNEIYHDQRNRRYRKAGTHLRCLCGCGVFLFAQLSPQERILTLEAMDAAERA